MLVDLPLVAVADGVGGAPGGDIAAESALDALDEAARGPKPAGVRLLAAFAVADRQVVEAGLRRDLPDMATTAVAALLEGTDLFISHLGDSRAYRMRDDRLECLTRDDRLVAELERRGMITAAQAQTHPWRPLLTRALGLGTPASASLRVEAVQPGDLYLLCTDGLTDALPDEAIATLLAEGHSITAAVGALIAAARDAGAKDDVTVAIVCAR